MRPIIKSTTGAGVSTSARVNRNQPDFKLGLYVKVTGTVAYTIEHSATDPEGGDYANEAAYAAAATWFATDGLTGETASAESNIVLPVEAVRINQASGAGTVELTVLQSN